MWPMGLLLLIFLIRHFPMNIHLFPQKSLKVQKKSWYVGNTTGSYEKVEKKKEAKKLLVYGDKIQQTVESIETTTVILNLSYFFFRTVCRKWDKWNKF